MGQMIPWVGWFNISDQIRVKRMPMDLKLDFIEPAIHSTLPHCILPFYWIVAWNHWSFSVTLNYNRGRGKPIYISPEQIQNCAFQNEVDEFYSEIWEQVKMTETVFSTPLHAEETRHKSHYCWRVHETLSKVSDKYNSQRKQTREFGKILLRNGNCKTSMVQMWKSSYYWTYMLVDLLLHIWAKPGMCR